MEQTGLAHYTTDPIQCFCFGERAQCRTHFSNLPEQLEGGRGVGDQPVKWEGHCLAKLIQFKYANVIGVGRGNGKTSGEQKNREQKEQHIMQLNV